MLFTDNERRVYGPYFNGAQAVFGDPFKINRTLIHLLNGEPNQVIADYNSKEPCPAKFEATDKLLKAGVEAFGLIPFDAATGQGSLESDVIKVVTDFMKWCSKKNETPAPMPTSLPPSDGLPSQNPFGGPLNGNNFKTGPGYPTTPSEVHTDPMPSMPRVGLPSG